MRKVHSNILNIIRISYQYHLILLILTLKFVLSICVSYYVDEVMFSFTKKGSNYLVGPKKHSVGVYFGQYSTVF